MKKLNASKFEFNYIERDLEFILSAIYFCYIKIVASNKRILKSENDIRDVFISDDYLNNHLVKQELGILEYLFDKEIQTKDGRIDIRVLNMVETMKGSYKPYYFIECKKLDGVINLKNQSTLNHKYISEGINRFIQGKYPNNKGEHGMLGFVVNAVDIGVNSNFFAQLTPFKFIDFFEYTYKSSHTSVDNSQFVIYHLMLNFSKIVY